MKNLVEVDIVKVLVGDIDRLELNVKNTIIINFLDIHYLKFSLKNSYEIDFDHENKTAQKFNTIIAEVIGDENDDIIANIFFGKSEVSANLVIFDRGYKFEVKVRPFLKPKENTPLTPVKTRLELIARANRQLRL